MQILSSFSCFSAVFAAGLVYFGHFIAVFLKHFWSFDPIFLVILIQFLLQIMIDLFLINILLMIVKRRGFPRAYFNSYEIQI